jgi:hypothetical protein
MLVEDMFFQPIVTTLSGGGSRFFSSPAFFGLFSPGNPLKLDYMTPNICFLPKKAKKIVPN